MGKNRKRNYETIEQTPKSLNSIRKAPIPESLIPILKEQKKIKKADKLKVRSSYKENDYIFTSESGKILNGRNMARAYERILKSAEIKYKKFH